MVADASRGRKLGRDRVVSIGSLTDRETRCTLHGKQTDMYGTKAVDVDRNNSTKGRHSLRTTVMEGGAGRQAR